MARTSKWQEPLREQILHRHIFFRNFIDLALRNTDFRFLAHSENNSQVVLMSIKPQEDIGYEVHSSDQITIFVQGTAQAVVEGASFQISGYDLLFIPAGSRHNIINTGDIELKLINVYAPPVHSAKENARTKAEAEAYEHEHSAKA